MGKLARGSPRKVEKPSSKDAKLTYLFPYVKISKREKELVEAAINTLSSKQSVTPTTRSCPIRACLLRPAPKDIVQKPEPREYSLRTRPDKSNKSPKPTTMNPEPVVPELIAPPAPPPPAPPAAPISEPPPQLPDSPEHVENDQEMMEESADSPPSSESTDSEDDDDDDIEMQVLEKQVESDVESTIIPFPDDTDEESSLLSPSALPESQLVRSPTSRKKKPAVPSPSTSTLPLPSMSSSPIPRAPLKRGRGRPRKALEDVKSVSGKLYRKKLAERTLNPQPQALAPASQSQATMHHDVYDPTPEDYFGEDAHEPFERLHRWKDRSTFVYAKHKFVSNENKFRCDVCQVSFTALSSLKRHYGTIYHKQQEAAGSSNLDLSDILRPEMSSNVDSGMPMQTAVRRGRGRPPLAARTSSFIRRNAVDNIKKYYAAADAARRRREKFITNVAFMKQQRRRKPLVHSDYLYSSASPYSESDPDQQQLPPNPHLLQNGNNQQNLAPWRSSVWKGIGPPHFTCEYCGMTGFEKKFDFTAHVFEHREEESRRLALTCPDCQKMFPNTHRLDEHFDEFNHGIGIHRARKPVKRLACDMCKSRFSSREYYLKHMETHKRSESKCFKCGDSFEFKFHLQEHIRLNHMSEPQTPVEPSKTPRNELLNEQPLPLRPKIELYCDSTPLFQPIRKPDPKPAVKKPETTTTGTTLDAAATQERSSKSLTMQLPPNTFVLNDGMLVKPTESIIQKFFESQERSKSPDISAGVPPAAAGQRSENPVSGTCIQGSLASDGKLVFQLENSFILNDDACNLSPLTIEIPRDNLNVNTEAAVVTPGLIPPAVPSNNPVETPESLHSTDSNSSAACGMLTGCGVKNPKAIIQPDNQLQCQDCGKTFEVRKSLISHVRYFTGAESYSCSLCGKGFKLKHHVARHKRIHHNIDLSSSSSVDDPEEGKRRKGELESSFSRSNYEPVTDQNGDTVFKCLICKKFYPSKHQISSHLSYHKRTQGFKCATCHSSFKLEQEYNMHVCRGTPEALKCDTCPDLQFNERKDLLKHMREVHSSLARKPLSFLEHEVCRCPVCPLVFPTTTDLDAHVTEAHRAEFQDELGGNEPFDDDDEEEEDDELEENTSSPEFELLELN